MNSAIIVVDFPRVVNLAYTKYEAVSLVLQMIKLSI